MNLESHPDGHVKLLGTDPSKWRMVDHERGAILIFAGMAYPMSEERKFKIIWQGKEILFSAIYIIDGLRDDGQSKIRWDILTCHMPQELVDKKSEIKQLIIDAMKDYGFSYGKKMAFMQLMFLLAQASAI